MSVKIDKYKLQKHNHDSRILDRESGYMIVEVSHMKKEPREALAEDILDLLNTGKYEGDVER